MHSSVENGGTLAAIAAEMKEELKEFVQTRIEMLKQELREKAARLKIAAPLAAVGCCCWEQLTYSSLCPSLPQFQPRSPVAFIGGFSVLSSLVLHGHCLGV